MLQGNWREMQALLQEQPHLKTANAGGNARTYRVNV
jgi:hypothetical protein